MQLSETNMQLSETNIAPRLDGMRPYRAWVLRSWEEGSFISRAVTSRELGSSKQKPWWILEALGALNMLMEQIREFGRLDHYFH